MSFYSVLNLHGYHAIAPTQVTDTIGELDVAYPGIICLPVPRLPDAAAVREWLKRFREAPEITTIRAVLPDGVELEPGMGSSHTHNFYPQGPPHAAPPVAPATPATLDELLLELEAVHGRLGVLDLLHAHTRRLRNELADDAVSAKALGQLKPPSDTADLNSDIAEATPMREPTRIRDMSTDFIRRSEAVAAITAGITDTADAVEALRALPSAVLPMRGPLAKVFLPACLPQPDFGYGGCENYSEHSDGSDCEHPTYGSDSRPIPNLYNIGSRAPEWCPKRQTLTEEQQRVSEQALESDSDFEDVPTVSVDVETTSEAGSPVFNPDREARSDPNLEHTSSADIAAAINAAHPVVRREVIEGPLRELDPDDLDILLSDLYVAAIRNAQYSPDIHVVGTFSRCDLGPILTIAYQVVKR